MGRTPFFDKERALLLRWDEPQPIPSARASQAALEATADGRLIDAQLLHAQQLELMGTLATGIAHDFNNVLTVIGGNTELALDEVPADSLTHELLVDVLHAYERARDLVRRILLFSREQKSDLQPVALAHVVTEALSLLRASLPADVRIVSEFAADLPTVMADGTQMHQIVMNLGTNAGKAMAAAGGTLIVQLDAVNGGASDADGRLRDQTWLRLRVRDTGTGMTREVMDRMLEPFFTTDTEHGTGLGLSVVDGIVRAHGGMLDVASTPGLGSEFTVLLPAAAAPSRGPGVARPELPRGSGQHVMYVDDEPALAALMTRTLDRLGYQCTAFTDPIAALTAFQGDPMAFDAVIADQRMPLMSGPHVVAAVRNLRPDVPVALTSGFASGVDDQLADVPWLHKPATSAEVATTLSHLFAPPAEGPAPE